MALTVSDLIKYKRQKFGLSARQLSGMAGLSPSYVSKVENGTIKPSLDAFGKIVRLLEFSDVEIAFVVKKIAGVDE